MKKALLLFLIAIMTASFAMAGGQRNNSSGPRTLKVLLSEEPEAFMAVLRKWAAETGNNVEPLIIPYDDQLAKFPQMIRNRDLPDLVYTTRLGNLYRDDFVDLTNQINTSIFEPRALEQIGKPAVFGVLTSVPIQFTITIVFYNADAFARAGLQPPAVDRPWTIDEVFANGKRLQDSGAVKYGVAMDFSRARYDNMMYMNGGSMVSREGSDWNVTINSPQNVAALQTFIDANNAGIMPKAIWAGGSSDNPADYFKNGDVGIYFSGTWNYGAFVNDIKTFNWGVMPSPAGRTGRSAIIGGSGLGVPKGAPNQALGIEFINWFYANPANFQYYLDIDRGMSSLRGVTYKPATPQGIADYAVMQAEVANVTQMYIMDESSYWRDYKDNEYRDYLKQAVNGDLTATAALNNFARDLSESSRWRIR